MKKIIVVAGGTGGHINAALAIGEKFRSKDYDVHYISGTRPLDIKLYSGQSVTHLNATALVGKSPLFMLKSLFFNSLVFAKCFLKFLLSRPKFAIGAGGYICGPVLGAAWILRVPVYILEQNSVMGMTNKLLSRISKRIFLNFEKTINFERSSNSVVVGNPIRSDIVYREQVKGDSVNVLVFGGSLGADQINNALFELMKDYKGKKLNIRHQVGLGNLSHQSEVSDLINYEQREYLDDMASDYQWANIIICRAGASTVSELRIMKRPVIIIPYPGHSDRHQFHNAQNLKEEDAFFVSILDKRDARELAHQINFEINKIVSEGLFAPKLDIKVDVPQNLIFNSIHENA